MPSVLQQYPLLLSSQYPTFSNPKFYRSFARLFPFLFFQDKNKSTSACIYLKNAVAIKNLAYLYEDVRRRCVNEKIKSISK